MSGGSWDYLTFKMDEAASNLKLEKDPLRRAFGKKMELFAKAMYDIEWVDSGDKSPGDELPAIKKALGAEHKTLALKELIEEAQVLIKELEKYCDV